MKNHLNIIILYFLENHWETIGFLLYKNKAKMPLIYRNITRMSYCVHRYIHGTAVNNKVFNYANREGKFMRKIVSNELPKR